MADIAPGRMPTGARIRERRLARGLRQAHLAAEAGISPSYLNLIEHGRRPVGGALLGRLATALGVERTALSGGEDDDLLAALRLAGATHGLEGAALATATDLARRLPDWARVVAAQARALTAQSAAIEALSDRLTHDPALAEAMHELLSTVSVVRSTAAILAQTPDLDRNWLGRFHANLDADSRRLADGAQAVRSYLDVQGARGDARLTAAEAVARFLDAAGHVFAPLEAEGAAAIPALVAGLADLDARAMASAVLSGDAVDAARLPRAAVVAVIDGGGGPDDLLDAAGGDGALALRRLGLTDPGRGLAVCDAAGAMLRRKPAAGFPLPVVGAGCPLWPLYAVLSQPGRGLVETIEMPDGAQWVAHALAVPALAAGFGAPAPMRATMLLTRAARPDAAARPVGPGCRVCSRDACPARREPSVLRVAGSVAPLDSRIGVVDSRVQGLTGGEAGHDA